MTSPTADNARVTARALTCLLGAQEAIRRNTPGDHVEFSHPERQLAISLVAGLINLHRLGPGFYASQMDRISVLLARRVA